MMVYPLRTTSEADFRRALELAEAFNERKPKLPIKIEFTDATIESEATDEAPAKGFWYADVKSASPSRLQHFFDELQRIERNTRKLIKALKAAPVEGGQPVTVSTMDETPTKKSKSRKAKPAEELDPLVAAIAGNLSAPEPRARKKKGPKDATA